MGQVLFYTSSTQRRLGIRAFIESFYRLSLIHPEQKLRHPRESGDPCINVA